MDIGIGVAVVRKHKQMSQQELANKSGLTQVTISLIETGKSKPHSNSLDMICEALKTNKHTLILLSYECIDVHDSKWGLYSLLYPAIQELTLKFVGD